VIAEYSSHLTQEQRNEIISRFKKNEINLLISSDAMARGMDIEYVETVISYDVPLFIKTYIHRVGRTARANKEGKTFTLLRKEEVRHFKDILRRAENNYVKTMKVKQQDLEHFIVRYEEALTELKAVVQEEKIKGK